MKDKYYTPTLEEFHVGFEYEALVDYYQQEFEKFTIDDTDSLRSICSTWDRGEVEYWRVKYLDREDIESLGFNRIEECENYNNNESTYQKRVSDDEIYCLVFHYDINKVTISVHDKDIKTNMSVERKFQGTLKNKSELINQLKRCGI